MGAVPLLIDAERFQTMENEKISDKRLDYSIKERLESLPGLVSFFYQNLETGEMISLRPRQRLMAASVIKLYVMAEAFRRIEAGELNPDLLIAAQRKDCVPSCGAITYLHEGLEVTVMDLITLMIIFSDNTATNILIDLMGMEKINEGIRSLGFQDVHLRRKMFDLEKSRLGIQNIITAEETGGFFQKLYEGTLVSQKASEQMLTILKCQQLNGKIPFYLKALEEEPEIAHKTGEDTGITHDVGIVFGREPFIVCFCGNETDTPRFERMMAEISLELFQRAEKGAAE